MDLFTQQLTMFTASILFFLPSINSASFNITHFDSNTTHMEYRGDARPSAAGAVDLNLDEYDRMGQVFFSEHVRLQDFRSNQLADFTTHFSFIIDTSGSSFDKHGDGIVFFVSPVGFQSPENSGGGGLGLYPGPSTDKSYEQKHPVLAVEFDSFANPEWDPPYEHVGININSLSSSVHTPWNVSFHSGDTADAWVSYNASTKNLSVSWSYLQATSNPNENSSLSFHVDLREVMPVEWIKVGIGAATGGFFEKHALKSWQFSSSFDSKMTKGLKIDKIIMIALLCFGALVGGCIVAYFTIRGRKLRNKPKNTEGESLVWTTDFERGVGSRRFSYRDLASATNNFSNDRNLGQGGFGAVYKGHLPELDMDVAVKKFSKDSRQGVKDYIAEAIIVSQLRHRNLVKLIGWCHDRGQFLLVYEFVPNGSLDSHLFSSHNCTLTWAIRYKICLGLTTALLYLHNEWEQCVVHRDIKAGNIMLDSCFNVKLGDFGLARLMDHELGPRTTCLAGTLGYMAPEYIFSGKASSKSDVFSFGIVILEIVTGRRSRDPRNNAMSLVEWVWELYEQDKPLEAIDEKLEMKFNEEQAKLMITVGLWCAHPDHSLRPSVKQVIQVLKFETKIPDLPSYMPIPIYQVPWFSPRETSVEPSITNSLLETGR